MSKKGKKGRKGGREVYKERGIGEREKKPVVHRQYMVSGNLALPRLPLTIYCLWTTGF